MSLMEGFDIKDKAENVSMSYRQYDTRCPYDRAAMLLDWCGDEVNPKDVSRVLWNMGGLLTQFGKKVSNIIDLMTGSIATNEKTGEKYYNLCKGYKEWLEKNNLEIPKDLKKTLEVNKIFYENIVIHTHCQKCGIMLDHKNKSGYCIWHKKLVA